MVYCNDIINLAKKIFDPDKLSLNLSLVIRDMLHQQLQAKLQEFEQKLQAQIFELVADLASRVRI